MQIEHKTLLDGVIVVFQNFKTLTICRRLDLPSNVAIQRVPATYYRSLTTFSSYNKLIKVGFGYHDDMSLDIVVAHRKVAFRRVSNIIESSGSDDDLSDDMQEQREVHGTGEFGIIRNCFIDSINQSAMEIGCWKFQCCKSYSEILQRRNCDCFITRSIECQDNNATKFGLIFFENFQTLLREKLQNRRIDVFFTLRSLGQNTAYSNARVVLAKCKLNYALELVVHCSRDYYVPGHALFWNTKQLKVIRGQPKMEFYPGLLKGCGNLYFEQDHNDNAETEVKLVKYYSHLFKEIDVMGQRRTPPFSQPLLNKYLCEQLQRDEHLDYQQWIESVLKILNKYKDATKKFLCCRQELICSCLKLSQLSLPDILEDMKQKLSFKRVEGSKNFKAIKLDIFLSYLEGFMRPLLYCIASEVGRKVLCEYEKTFFYINEGKYK